MNIRSWSLPSVAALLASGGDNKERSKMHNTVIGAVSAAVVAFATPALAADLPVIEMA